MEWLLMTVGKGIQQRWEQTALSLALTGIVWHSHGIEKDPQRTWRTLVWPGFSMKWIRKWYSGWSLTAINSIPEQMSLWIFYLVFNNLQHCIIGFDTGGLALAACCCNVFFDSLDHVLGGRAYPVSRRAKKWFINILNAQWEYMATDFID